MAWITNITGAIETGVGALTFGSIYNWSDLVINGGRVKQGDWSWQMTPGLWAIGQGWNWLHDNYWFGESGTGLEIIYTGDPDAWSKANNPRLNTGIINGWTTGLAGQPVTGMMGAASNSANLAVDGCTHWTRSPLYKSAVLSGWWSEYRGQFSFMTDETLTTPSGGLWNISNGAVLSSCTGQTQDSQDEPGELVYNMGSIPTQTGYGPRYNW